MVKHNTDGFVLKEKVLEALSSYYIGKRGGKKIYDSSISSAMAHIDSLETFYLPCHKSRWIKSSVELPREVSSRSMTDRYKDIRPSYYVLCKRGEDIFKGYYSYSQKIWIRYDESTGYSDVTHWMPLTCLEVK